MAPAPDILGLTMGEPAGIGPDITIAAWKQLAGSNLAFCLFGDPEMIAERADQLGTSCPVEVIEQPAATTGVFETALPVLQRSMSEPVNPGEPCAGNAEAVLASIRRAVELTLKQQIAGVVTNPIHKSVLYGSGFTFQGHTDFLAELARQHGHEARPVMMLVSGDLRTVPLTVHIPLKDVPSALTTDVIVDQCQVIFRDLQQYFGISRPKIGMTGLNPHAGENSTIGTEERDIIAPAITTLAGEGIAINGPLPADTVFHGAARAKYDVIVCMYHDQALIPVKTIGFCDGVNATLGLPFVRTSPDHGTALALAGTGKANPSSLIAAIRLATQMVRQRKTTA